MIDCRLQSQGVLVSELSNLKIGDIDQLMSKGFKPLILVRQSTADIPEVHDEADIMMPQLYWSVLSLALKGVNERLEDEPADKRAREQLQRASADAVFYGAYIAHRWGCGSLAESISMNVKKTGARVLTGTLDNTKGPRLHETGVQ